jgi:hypothetical protein
MYTKPYKIVALFFRYEANSIRFVVVDGRDEAVVARAGRMRHLRRRTPITHTRALTLASILPLAPCVMMVNVTGLPT